MIWPLTFTGSTAEAARGRGVGGGAGEERLDCRSAGGARGRGVGGGAGEERLDYRSAGGARGRGVRGITVAQSNKIAGSCINSFNTYYSYINPYLPRSAKYIGKLNMLNITVSTTVSWFPSSTSQHLHWQSSLFCSLLASFKSSYFFQYWFKMLYGSPTTLTSDCLPE